MHRCRRDVLTALFAEMQVPAQPFATASQGGADPVHYLHAKKEPNPRRIGD